jgi:hypothetical protein
VVCVFTRPTYSSINFGFVPAAAMRVAAAIIRGIGVSLGRIWPRGSAHCKRYDAP